MKKILFVCTGNTCRSPMAEGIMNKIINDDPLLKGKFIAESAGISADNNQAPHPNAVSSLKNLWNIDISGLTSMLVNNPLIKNSFIVLTMTKQHSDYLLFDFPLHKNKIFTLKEYLKYNSKNLDIADPFGQDKSVYESCAKEIYDCLILLAEKLRKG